MINNICFFNSNKAWGGGEKWHLETAKWYRNQGFQVTIFAYTNKELHRRALSENINTIPVKISNLSFLNLFKVFSVAEKLKKTGCQIVILNLPNDIKAGGIAAKLAGIKNIWYRRGLAIPIKNSFLNRVIFKTILTKIIANSLDIRNKILLHHPYLEKMNKIEILNNGIDISHYPAEAVTVKKEDKPIIFGNVGRMVEQKAQKYLLELALQLKLKNYLFEIIIAGTGKLENELKKKAQELDVVQYVNFLGFTEDLSSFYKKIDIFILTSLHEGTSNAMIEAMAYGKPVIAFNISSMPEMILNNENGYLVEFADIKSLTQAASQLIEDADLRKRMGNKSIEIVHKNYNMEQNLKSLIDFAK